MYNKVWINIFSIEITIQNAICNVVWIILNRCFPNPTYVGNRRRGYSWHNYICLFWVVWIMKILLRHWAKQSICNWHLGWMTFCTCCAHIEHHIVIFFLQKLALLSHRYWGTVLHTFCTMLSIELFFFYRLMTPNEFQNIKILFMLQEARQLQFLHYLVELSLIISIQSCTSIIYYRSIL